MKRSIIRPLKLKMKQKLFLYVFICKTKFRESEQKQTFLTSSRVVLFMRTDSVPIFQFQY